MSIERIFYCDGPECERHVQTRERRAETFVVVTEGGSAVPLHFCGWDCVLRHAAAKPPSEVVVLDD